MCSEQYCLSLLFSLFFLTLLPPPRSTHRYTLFPYTTLFRSQRRISEASPDAGMHRLDRGLRQRAMDLPNRKSTRLNSKSHSGTSYAVFCLKKKMDLEDRVLSPLADVATKLVSMGTCI